MLVDKKDTELRLLGMPKGLDREEKANYTLIITTYNFPNNPPTDLSPSNNHTLTLTILVDDVNDNVPYFEEELIFSSFIESDTNGKVINTIRAIDPDQDEVLTYSIPDDFQWHDTDIILENPFTITSNDDNTASLKLNFEPKGVTKGFCNFTIHVRDNLANHTSMTKAKVYAITPEYLLSAYFYNSIQEIQSQQKNIINVFSMVLGYTCFIDSISEYQGTSEDAVRMRNSGGRNTTLVLMHFVDSKLNAPVSVDIIEGKLNDGEVASLLIENLNVFGLSLVTIQKPPGITEDNSTNTLLTLKILLGVVTMVLSLLVIMLITAYVIRTRSLERKVKALSASTYGMEMNDSSQPGMDLTKVPGSNLFTAEGTNPMYNMPDTQLGRGDSNSISSGDSVLVGVEDNPEFLGHTGAVNPTFSSTHSIDEVSSPPEVNGGPKINPLLNLDMEEPEDMDLSSGIAGLERTSIAPSMSESEDMSPPPINDNFSFGKL